MTRAPLILIPWPLLSLTVARAFCLRTATRLPDPFLRAFAGAASGLILVLAALAGRMGRAAIR
jgi:hypothetical protein